MCCIDIIQQVDEMDFKEFSAKFGLSERQSGVYGCLFSLGSASAADIVQRTGINRTLVYDYLNLLIEKGLVTISMINNKRVFTALEPKTLIQNIEDELNDIEKKKKRDLQELRDSIEDLGRYFNTSERASVGILLGKKGVRNLFRDIVSTLKRGQEDLVFIANYEGRGLLGSTIENYYTQCRKKGIRIRVIFDSRPRTTKIGTEISRLPHAKVRFLPAEYSTLTTFHVYGDKASLLLFSEGEVFGLLIENKKVAKGLKKHFEALWKLAEHKPHKL
ncbi:MAG: helix-turn-helix domain-containing protein [Candidatus Micrarchaeota archaeon]